jgi:hypothetical protein
MYYTYIYVCVHICVHARTHKYGLALSEFTATTYAVRTEKTYKYTKDLASLTFVTGS